MLLGSSLDVDVSVALEKMTVIVIDLGRNGGICMTSETCFENENENVSVDASVS